VGLKIVVTTPKIEHFAESKNGKYSNNTLTWNFASFALVCFDLVLLHVDVIIQY
jgi:hypothetical protein